jgi:hypothetical protein
MPEKTGPARAQEERVWMIGPESKVYHRARSCPRLKGPYRYYEAQSVRLYEAQRRGRRPCKVCHA